MPIYEFFCSKCGAEKEEFFKKPIKKGEEPICDCGEKMKIKISETSFKLMGRGWADESYTPGSDKRKIGKDRIDYTKP